jgi:hypothetical protein
VIRTADEQGALLGEQVARYAQLHDSLTQKPLRQSERTDSPTMKPTIVHMATYGIA